MENEKLVDLNVLNTFTGNDKELIKLHVGTFLEFAPAQVDSLQEHLRNKEWMQLKNTAHKLKPKLSYMGIKSLVPDIQMIEDYGGEEKNLDHMDALVNKVADNCRLAFEELKALL